ncbi:hypothetical protein K523DRAFT_408923 [Schizophyllum commune Tattone D]|nr:hypothetical protein K523DRAFT_408923 [Schizophyllum commune Tattone D]
MPPSILSTAIATQKDLDALPIINYESSISTPMEHLEYYWGLEKGELSLSTPLNHIQLRSDMAYRMEKSEWALLPTKKTLDAMNALSDFNETAGVDKRKRFTEPKIAQAKTSIYDYIRSPPSLPRSPALPRNARASDSGSSDSDVDVVFSAVDLRGWLDSISSEFKTKRASPPSSNADAILARYRKEPARAPADALRGTLLRRHGGLYGGGSYANCRYIYSSNDWAMHIYTQCLWSSNPPKAARFDYVDLVP